MKKSNGMNAAVRNSNYIKSFLVSMNDGVRICSEACACCWDKKIPNEYNELCNYIGRRAKIGHTSILEHSSFITVTRVPFFTLEEDFKKNTNFVESLVDVLCACRYVNVRVKSDDSNYWFLIGGSYRGYGEIFKRLSINADIVSNAFTRALTGPIYGYLRPECMLDLIVDNILDVNSFNGVEPDPVTDTFTPMKRKYVSDKVEVISVDDIIKIRRNLFDIVKSDIFTNDDIMRVAYLTVLFKDISRTATHQLVRHRNGITQESQRYVDYSNAGFADPTEFKPDKYDKNKNYVIKFCGKEFNLTSSQLGEELIGIYQDMIDQGMMKEDARAFLPSNVKCRKLYMTFTYQTFLKFLKLRTATAAQAEIRSFAMDLQKHIPDYIDIKALENDTPIIAEGVDQIISTREEIFENIKKSQSFTIEAE